MLNTFGNKVKLTAKMKPQIKKLWLAALRSGKYKQGIGALKTSDGKYCCLGVLCNLYSKASGVSWEDNGTNKVLKDTSECGVLPPNVRKWAGLHSKEVTVKVPTDKLNTFDILNSNRPFVATNLIELNDESGFSFKEIADVVEQNL